MGSGISDSFNRNIDYIRISITDRCNLRCRYCMPEEGVNPILHSDILSFEEILRIVNVLIKLGFQKFRITGGEPLVRKGAVDLIKEILSLSSEIDISLTTNGILLASMAERLFNAGLRRINISLDTMDPEKFSYITRGGSISEVLLGIRAANKAGLNPIKVNTVVMKGFNDNEIHDIIEFSRNNDCVPRFIEFMPVDKYLWGDNLFVASDEILDILSKIDPNIEQSAEKGFGPALYYKLPKLSIKVGIIAAVTRHFCSSCNRLRLSAKGELLPCLFSDSGTDLKALIRSRADDDLLANIITEVIYNKPQRWIEIYKKRNQEHHMSSIGG